MKKRNKLEIIKDILKIIQESRSIRPTPLLRKSNLSSPIFRKYYSELLSKNFIEETREKNKKIILTKKGQKYLEKYFAIINFIEEFEL
jgi:predicted transcriptional regulator